MPIAGSNLKKTFLLGPKKDTIAMTVTFESELGPITRLLCTKEAALADLILITRECVVARKPNKPYRPEMINGKPSEEDLVIAASS